MDSYDIIKLQNIAYVDSQIASFYAELEAMKAENEWRIHRGETIAYDYNAFTGLIDKYQLGHNSVLTNFQNGL